MRRRLTALLVLSVVAMLPVSGPSPIGAAAAEAQETARLRLTVSPEFSRQMKEAPGELSWSELPEHLTVEFASSEALPMDRVPIRLVAVAVREGEILGRAATTPSVATAGESLPASSLAGGGWPPAGEWFPASAWRPDGISSPTAPVPPEAEAAASQITLPSNAGGVMLFAAPAADALVQRFRTLPVVVTTWPTSDPAGADSAAADTTRAGATGGAAGGD